MGKKNPTYQPAPVHNRKMYFHRAHILFCPFQCTSQLLARACALSRVKCPHDLLFALSPFLFLSFSAHLCTGTTVYVSWNSVSQTGKQTEKRVSSPNEVSSFSRISTWLKKKREKRIFSFRFKSFDNKIGINCFDVSYLAKFREQNSKENFSCAFLFKKKREKEKNIFFSFQIIRQ